MKTIYIPPPCLTLRPHLKRLEAEDSPLRCGNFLMTDTGQKPCLHFITFTTTCLVLNAVTKQLILQEKQAQYYCTLLQYTLLYCTCAAQLLVQKTVPAISSHFETQTTVAKAKYSIHKLHEFSNIASHFVAKAGQSAT